MTHILRQQPSQASASRCFRIHVHSYHILIIVSRISPLITHPNSWILRWKASTCSPQAPQTLLPTDGQKHKIRPPNCHINCCTWHRQHTFVSPRVQADTDMDTPPKLSAQTVLRTTISSSNLWKVS
ncbi:hypothetical protein M404DRAFT_1002793 [Pisolithus tinctorius Marx 270]|uniref:Uncharacterized protein n=1 Tax=Pisolithus tinctorius Marx 270 TaxID=870435 RepID=A0A0C3NL20_PISTI|nr:hypothetical protein M404DRAFT_1002793 [Pisolithus tinctorius Marx 270]